MAYSMLHRIVEKSFCALSIVVNCIGISADIFYDRISGINLIQNYDLTGKFFALTRYNKLDHLKKLLKDYPGQTGKVIATEEGLLRSQHLNGSSIDTWIYRTPIVLDFRCSYRMGIAGCDSAVCGFEKVN